jgi:hypothetical protein
MSDPATDPAHDLLDHPQDDVHDPRVRLGTFLSWCRVLAGPQGLSSIKWSGAGFTYTLTVHRTTDQLPEPSVLFDPDAAQGDELRDRVRDVLT